MLADDSVLRRIPANLDPKQALFIDGIRHAVEILDLAYHRLREALTHLALNPPDSEALRAASPTVFLDAWAVVDAIDRFRMLYTQMPGVNFGPPSPGIPTLKEVTAPFRNLRNVADHLAQRADFVLSRGGAALGVLTWMTGHSLDPVGAWFCTLRPGTIREQPKSDWTPIETTIDWPTDRICLVAGGYQGNLSAVRPHIERRVRHFETQIERALSRPELANFPAANDVFTRQHFKLSPGQFPEQTDA